VLAALPPEDVEPETEHKPTPSIVVYDLPPGADPVLHRAPKRAEAPVSPAEGPSEQPPAPNTHTFFYDAPNGEGGVIGSWSPAGLDQSQDGVFQVSICRTDDRETAELCGRAELDAGRLPQSTENLALRAVSPAPSTL
jgi:hypothetical protein